MNTARRAPADAGNRVVTMPAAIVPAIAEHLARFAKPGDDGLVFVRPLGGVLRESNFNNKIWHKATAEVGVPYLHFHDIRHPATRWPRQPVRACGN